MPRLTVVPPSEPAAADKVRLRVKAAPKPASMLQCNRCGGRELLETRTGVLYENGKVKGGTKQMVCATCHMNGERVVIA